MTAPPPQTYTHTQLLSLSSGVCVRARAAYIVTPRPPVPDPRFSLLLWQVINRGGEIISPFEVRCPWLLPQCRLHCSRTCSASDSSSLPPAVAQNLILPPPSGFTLPTRWRRRSSRTTASWPSPPSPRPTTPFRRPHTHPTPGLSSPSRPSSPIGRPRPLLTHAQPRARNRPVLPVRKTSRVQ